MFPRSVERQLGYYIYLYIHPDTDEIFYVGKGQGNRAFSHLDDNSESEKTAIINELRTQGKKPKIDILIHGISDKRAAYKIEASVIDLLGKTNLTNKVRGWGSGSYGRMPYKELISMYVQEKAQITEPSILIRINTHYRFGMSPIELYDTTRSFWRIGARREKAKLAFSVYDGIVKEVYEIKCWMPAGESMTTREDAPPKDRWEFIGNIAKDSIRNKYLNKSVASYFQKRARNPIQYVNL